MNNTTWLLILLAFFTALFVALFQYWYKDNHRLKGIYGILAALRFLTVFAILILLINPKFENTTVFEEKPDLIIAIDNSESIKYLGQDSISSKIIAELNNDEDLRDRFQVKSYVFGENFEVSDKPDFGNKHTEIAKVWSGINDVYEKQNGAIVLLTDGNQTKGNDYVQSLSKINQAVYPIVLGDTTNYEDLYLARVNVNRYSYVNNEFPVEIIAVYNGKSSINTNLTISSGSGNVYSKPLQLDSKKSSEVINLTLPSGSAGVKRFSIGLSALDNEKNIKNNRQTFVVEVLDQRNTIALVSSIIHPDLGAIKKSLESNQQRTVDILSPSEFIKDPTKYQLAIIYQPTAIMADALTLIEKSGLNTFYVTGPKTAWNLINTQQPNFTQEITSQTEDFVPTLNSSYPIFNLEFFKMEDYPPLVTEFGETKLNVPYETLIYKSVNGISLNEPLLATYEIGGKKYGLLNGEGIWQWRAHCYRINGSFQDFDDFFGKLVQYLGNNNRKSRLEIDFENINRETDPIEINAHYFDKGFEFDNTASLSIALTNKDTKENYNFPMVLANNAYRIRLGGLLSPGTYQFTIKAEPENVSRSGELTIAEYNVEEQFVNADLDKLLQVADRTQGEVYFPNTINKLKESLRQNSKYSPIQKSTKKIVPLIDWKYLLFAIALFLSLEWFLRKYNGLI